MEHHCAQRGVAMQEGELASGTDGCIRTLGSAIAVCTVAIESAKTNIEVLGRRNVEAAADAAAHYSIVVCACSGWNRGGCCIGINAVTEETGDAEELVVAPTRLLKGNLGDKIRSKVVG